MRNETKITTQQIAQAAAGLEPRDFTGFADRIKTIDPILGMVVGLHVAASDGNSPNLASWVEGTIAEAITLAHENVNTPGDAFDWWFAKYGYIDGVRADLEIYRNARFAGLLSGNFTGREIALVARLDAYNAIQAPVYDAMADTDALFGGMVAITDSNAMAAAIFANLSDRLRADIAAIRLTATIEPMDYKDVRNGTLISTKKAAQYRATWENGNDPDGETQVVISVECGASEGRVGYILTCDDNNCGGDCYEAGEEVYDTEAEALAAAVEFAAAHNEEKGAE